MSEPRHFYTRLNRIPTEILQFGDYAYRDQSRTLIIESQVGDEPTIFDGQPLEGTKAFSYNPDGSLNTVGGNGVISAFSYNPDGSLQSVNNGFVLKTFSYNPDGSLSGVTRAEIPQT